MDNGYSLALDIIELPQGSDVKVKGQLELSALLLLGPFQHRKPVKVQNIPWGLFIK